MIGTHEIMKCLEDYVKEFDGYAEKKKRKYQRVSVKGNMWVDLHFEKVTKTTVWGVNWNGAILGSLVK